MVDMTNYGGKEGGLVLDSEQDIIGMLLPSFIISDTNSPHFTFSISASTVLELADLRLDYKFGRKKEDPQKEILETKISIPSNICLI